MTHDFPRPLGMARMRGAVKDGKVDAYDLSIAYPSVTASQLSRQNLSIPGPDVAIVAGAWDQPFRDSELSCHWLSCARVGADQLVALGWRIWQWLSARLLPR